MNKSFDYIILGAGPAGLQLAYFLHKSGRDYLVLERESTAGAFFARYPRHRKLISINKVYTGYQDPEINLRWDWNSLLGDEGSPLFRDYSEDYFPSAEVMVRYLADYASHHGLRIEYGVEVSQVSRDGDFVLTDKQGRVYRSKRLVVATGNAKPSIPKVPGIEHAEQYADVSVDPKDFVNQRVLVIGKGNSGFETADNLIPTAALIHILSPTPINFAWKTRYVGHLRAVNNNLLDTYLLKSQNAILDAEVEMIERKDGKLQVTMAYTHSLSERETIAYDRVIVCAGFRFDDSIFDEACRPMLGSNQKHPAQTASYESPNVPDLYFAGTLMQMRDYRKTNSGFIHGFRYNVSALHRILERKYHDAPLPRHTVAATPDAINEAILNRSNRSSALWQQFGYIGDLIVVPPEGPAQYYEELPIDYIHDSDLGRNAHYFIATMEFGMPDGDPFRVLRYPMASKAHLSTGIHPVVRHFIRGSLIAEHHVLEDLFSQFGDDSRSGVLREFLHRQLAATGQ